MCEHDISYPAQHYLERIRKLACVVTSLKGLLIFDVRGRPRRTRLGSTSVPRLAKPVIDVDVVEEDPFRRLSVGVLTIGSALLFASCSGHGTGNGLPKDYGQDWLGQMSSQLAGDNAGDGGQLLVDSDNMKQARAQVTLQTQLAGPYDVLAVCRSTKTVHLAIRDITIKHDKHGESFDTKSLVGEANIHCGATTRIPIDVPKGRDGITLDATTDDTSERALFDAFIITRGSGQ